MPSEHEQYMPSDTVTHHELFARETRTVRDHIRIDMQYRAHDQHSITEPQLQATLDSMLEGCQILDFDLRYIYLNQNAIRHSRRPLDELVGKRIQDVYPDFESLPLYQAIRECLEDRIPQRLENQLTFPDGSIGDFEVSLLPASDGLVILTYEITERKRAEAELRASEQRFKEGQERFRLALDAAAFGTWQYDFVSNRVWVDETCQSHNGLSSSFLEPYEAYRRIHPADMPALREAAEKALNRTDDNGCFSGNYRIVHADGSYRWISLSARFQFGMSKGRRVPIQIHGLTNDVTEKMLAEMTARRQSAVLEQIAAGKPLQSVLEEIVALIEDQFPESYCSICLADLKSNQLRFAAGKKLPRAFVEAAAAIPIGPQCGSCGTAAYLKRPVLTIDIATDPLWEGSRHIPLKHHFRSCWSTPILTTPGDETNTSTAPSLLGMFSVYRKDPSPLPPGADSTIAAAVHLARLAIERENSSQTIRQSETEYSTICERLKTLSKQLIASREAELRHLARELHDEVGQSLTLMKMNLRNIQKQCDESLQMLLDANIAMIERTTDQVRSLSLDMRPPHLDDLGLVATLHWYLKQQAKVVGFQEKITVIPPDLCVPIELATICFRITQEAVTNAIRHASPSRIEIELHKQETTLDLTISDDGLGFDFSTARQKALEGSSLGLLNMEERASLAGGQMEIVSAPDQGTTIRVRFPQSRP